MNASNHNEARVCVVVDAVAVVSRPKNRLLRKALWFNTLFLLSLAAASRKLTDVDASKSMSVDPKGNTVLTESHELEVSDDYVVEHETSWNAEHGLDGELHDERKSIIVVATVDGSIAGLSRQTGQVLWRKNGVSLIETDLPSNKNDDAKNRNLSRVLSPLVSTTTTTKSASQHDSRTAAVPSVDGKVFLTAGRDKELTATSTLKELVARAPFVDTRGRFYVGSRQASAAAMDRDTGEILRVVTGGDVSTASQQQQEDEEGEGLFQGRKVVWVGRVDYSISLFDARSGAIDVKFSSSEIMGVQDMMVDDIEGINSQPHAPRLMLPTQDEANKQLAMLIATPNGNVALRNSKTGAIDWVSNETFNTPVIFALEATTGVSLGVDILPDAPLPDTSPEYLATQLERQMNLISTSEEPEQTIVGALSSGQLYAMPLGKRLSQTKHLTSIGLPHTTGSSSSALGFKGKSNNHLLNLGKTHAVGAHSHKSEEHSKKSALSKKTCVPTNPLFPGCLVGGIHHNHDFVLSLDGSFLDSDNAPNPSALLPFQQMPSIQNDLLELRQFRRNKRNFFKLMESWLPPTMVLIFVLSFEMGRRIKAKERRERESAVRGISPVESTSSISDLNTKNSTGVRSIGVIQVTDAVLGFGGHGTVVYRGTLDSRQVAVKRMLKAYHASADREISLLIESDGHPNVVRYFLKEVKGDFVYLALELCDMSLHELIVKLRKHMGEAGPLRSRHLRGTAQATLHQIACGVRHLHALRIVHRDLKPANILLALSSRTKAKSERTMSDSDIIDQYEQGAYIAKISDMGLGKQLAGQSSFGLSTLGQSSIQGSVNGGESSRLSGAGPGSVGWQAPEVMAIRWSAESPSIKSEESCSRTDSFMEASPSDLALSSRTSRSVDIFSLGCIFYCTLVPGSHPFGDWYEREANIMRNRAGTEDLLAASPEAHDLINAMISRDPTQRPTAQEVCEHPFFWSPRQKLAFLCDISDRVEVDSQLVEEGKDPSSRFAANIFAIERNAADVVGTAWDQSLDTDLINNVSKFRTYDPSSVRDCLRLIRNKHHHYDELPVHVKEKVGHIPDGLLAYFESRFPRLLMHCYKLSVELLEVDDVLAVKYSIPVASYPRRRICTKASAHSVCDGNIQTSTVPTCLTQRDNCDVECDPPEAALKSTQDACDMQLETSYANQAVPLSNLEQEKESNSFKKITETHIVNESDHCMDVDGLQSHSSIPLSDIIVWEGSTVAKSLKCRGWFRGDDEWMRKGDADTRKLDCVLTRCATDPKFRTRLCNHWDMSLGTFCPMQKRNKCIFAHGPVELRVKEGKKLRWGKLVDALGNNSNPKHSGGEDTYGAARSIEATRKEEGKWNTEKLNQGKPKLKAKQSVARKAIAGA